MTLPCIKLVNYFRNPPRRQTNVIRLPSVCVLGGFLAATSHADVVESADAAQPLAQRLADAAVAHVAGELADAGVERRLERQERGIRQQQDLIEESQDHVGPRLRRERKKILNV